MEMPGKFAGEVCVPVGSGRNGVLVVMDTPNVREAIVGKAILPWSDRGGILNTAMREMGMTMDDFTFTNLVPWYPRGGWIDGTVYGHAAIRVGMEQLDKLVARTRPKVILALGDLAFRELTGLSGPKTQVAMTRGFIVKGLHWGLPVVGSYEPRALHLGSKERAHDDTQGKVETANGRGMALMGVLKRDILLACQVAREGVPKFEFDDYKLGATLDQWREALRLLRNDKGLPISYDFETHDSLVEGDEEDIERTVREVTQVQISWRKGQALVSNWFPELLPTFKGIIELENKKFDWNGRKFDRPILREMQVRTDIGEWGDLMDLHHHAQPDLPRGLQYAASFVAPEAGPWKHYSVSDPHWYGALDTDMPIRIYEFHMASLAKVTHPLSGISLAQGYQEQVVDLAPVLDRMTARGIFIKEQKRLELDVEFTATLDELRAECQTLAPRELRPVLPKLGYIRDPPEVVMVCEACEGKGKISELAPAKKAGKFKVKKVVCLGCNGNGKIPKLEVPAGFVLRDFNGVSRWCREQEFLPGSWQQVLAYVKWRVEQDVTSRVTELRSKPRYQLVSDAELVKIARGQTKWYVPKDRDGKPTTASDELERLVRATDDRLLRLIVDSREIDKARGTYVRGWKPGEDGCVHPNFGFRPATGQTSCVARWTPIEVRVDGRLVGELPIDHIEVGDEVWTHKHRWMPVTGWWLKAPTEMFEVEFGNGQLLTCTGAHKLLCYGYEYKQEMGQRSAERGESSGDVSVIGVSAGGGDGEGVLYASSYDRLDIKEACSPRGTEVIEGDTIFSIKVGREESNEGQSAAQLQRGSGGWVRVSDLYKGWTEAVCTPANDGGQVGADADSVGSSSSSHRRGPVEQRDRQSSDSYARWASENSLASATGPEAVTITQINPVGSYEVYDITVAEDGSYSACGVFSHNSSEPNAQNFPSHGRLAEKMMAMLGSRWEEKDAA